MLTKIITVPLVSADSIAKEFKDLHLVRLLDFAIRDELYDFHLHYEAFLHVGLVVVYKELTRPNVLIYFSKRFADELIKSEDPQYWMRGVFYYWEDKTCSSI
jgi:hypothetical protein